MPTPAIALLAQRGLQVDDVLQFGPRLPARPGARAGEPQAPTQMAVVDEDKS